MSREKFKPCPQCGTGRVMTDELRRSHNAKVDGKIVCIDCKVKSIYDGRKA